MEKGDRIPDFLGIDAYGKEWRARDFEGSKLVIFFYPKDGTLLCTNEVCSIANGYNELLKAGYKVLGVSSDNALSHQKFAEEYSLPFPLIADTDLALNKAFGVWKLQYFSGGEYMGTERTTFLVDENGLVDEIITKVDTKDSANQILKLNK